MFALLLCAVSYLPLPPAIPETRVDCIEVNQVYNYVYVHPQLRQGIALKPVLRQLIFWSPWCKHLKMRETYGWRHIINNNLPVLSPDGTHWLLYLREDNHFYIIRARHCVATHTLHDPEREAGKRRPKEDRMPLFR